MNVYDNVLSSQGNAGRNIHIAIVVARFNEVITRRLLDGCLNELEKMGVKSSAITVVWVPGAFEIPLVALKFAKKKTVDAVICLGAVIRGQTFHYELVANQTAAGIMQAGLSAEKPVIFEVLAADTVKLVQDRAKVKGSNKGRDAAQSAIEMVLLLKKLKSK